MRLRTKLLLAQAPLAVALLAVAGAAFSFTRSLDDQASLILRRNYRHGLLVQQMQEDLERMEAAITVRLLGREPDPRGWEAARARFEEDLRVHEHEGVDSEEQAVAAPVREAWGAFVERAGDLWAAPAQARSALFLDSVTPALSGLRGRLVALGRFHDEHMRARAQQTSAFAARAEWGVLVASALALLLGGFAATGLLRQIGGPLQQLSRAASRIRAGDFDVSLAAKGGDEMGSLVRTFSEMARSLRRYRELSVDQLLRLRHALQTAVDSIPDPVLVFSGDGSLVTFNRAATTLLGLKEAGGLGSLAASVQRAVERAREHVLAGRGPYAPQGFEGAVQVEGGASQVVLLPRATPIEGDQGVVEGATVMLLDVTGLRRFDQLKSDFVSTVAHELRTPLTSLQLALGLCEEGVAGPLTEYQQKLIREAREDCDRLRTMVADLLDLARLESGGLTLQRQPVGASEVVRRAVEEAAAQAQLSGLTLAAEVEEGLGEILLDPERIRLVFSNLVSNALQYTARGGRVVVRASAKEGAMRFEVEDTGRGIGPEHLERVFEKFFRTPDSAPGGVGLGLWLAQEIVRAHGGRIGVESQVGAGSRFWFELSRG